MAANTDTIRATKERAARAEQAFQNTSRKVTALESSRIIELKAADFENTRRIAALEAALEGLPAKRPRTTALVANI